MTPVSVRSLSAIGTTVRVLVTDPASADSAEAVVREELDRLDRAVSRFRPDSEVSVLARVRTTRERGWPVSPLLREHLAAADRAFVLSGGLVDPTVGAALVRAGYDADLDVVRARGEIARATDVPAREASPVPGWRSVRLDPEGSLSLWPGTLLDLGATGKAHSADVLAARLAARLPGGFLVDLGGDIAVAGPTPAGGWAVGVEDPHGSLAQVVRIDGQALATSSTRARTWRVGGAERHHVIDPRTGEPARTPWAQVSVAAASALEANTAATASVVLGADAPAWLSARRLPARLLHHDGSVVTTAGWPGHAAPEELTA